MSDPFAGIVGQDDPFASIVGKAPDPFADIVGGRLEQPTTESIFAAGRAVAAAPTVPFAERHPLLDALLVQPFRDAADALVIAFTPQDQLNLLAEEDPVGTVQMVGNAQHGLAFMASLPIGAAFTKLPFVARAGLAPVVTTRFLTAGVPQIAVKLAPAASRTFGKAGAFLAGEFLSGNVYGAIKPLEEGESRAEAILTEGAIFAAAGGAFGGAIHGAVATGRGIRGWITRQPKTRQREMARLIWRRISALDDALKAEGTSINALPPEARANLITGVYKSVLDDLVPPQEIDLDAVVRESLELEGAHAQAAFEPHPRFGPELRPGLKVGPEPLELALPDPLDEIILTPEFARRTPTGELIPPRIEPTPAPKGFIAGPGAPERGPVRLTTAPQTMRALPDGSVEIVGYRGVAKGRDPLQPGVGESTFMADDPSVAVRYRSPGEGKAELLDALWTGVGNTVSRVRSVFRKPYIVDDFLDLEMGPVEAARFRELADRTLAGTLTDVERAEANNLLMTSLKTGEAFDRLRKAGYDGVIVREGMEGMEIIALDQKATRVEATVASDELKAGNLSPSKLFDGFRTYAFGHVRRGGTVEEAIELGARDMANEFGKPELIPEIRQVFAKLARFMGDDLAPRAQQAVTSLRGESAEMRTLLRNLEREAAENRLRRTADDVIESFSEPRQVTPAVPPPRGIEPTQIAERGKQVRIEGAASTVEEQLAMTNAAVKNAAARVDPLNLMEPDLRAARKVIEDAVDDPSIAPFRTRERLERALDKALVQEGPASAEGILLELTGPTPDELVLGRKLPKGQGRKVSQQLAESLRRESENLVEISPTELVRAQWAYGPGRSATPALDVMETVVRMTDDQLQAIGERMRKLSMGEAGFISGRTLALMLGSGAEIASLNEDIAPTPAAQNVLRSIGGLLLASALYAPIKGRLKSLKLTAPSIAPFKSVGDIFAAFRQRMAAHARGFILDLNPRFLMKDADSEHFRAWQEGLTSSREEAFTQEKIIHGVFGKDQAVHRNAVIAIEESDFAHGVFPAEYHQLTPVQQKMVEMINLYNLGLGQMLHSEGILKAYRRNYVSHRLPPETFQRWTTHGFRTLPTGGGFTKQRLLTFRELEQWAVQNNLPGPITDLAQLQWKHLTEAHRALSTVKLVKTLESNGLLKDAAPNALTPPTAGWRQLRIQGYGAKEAPDEIAHALENIASPRASKSDFLNSADTIKSYWMRSIMFWFWEHGLNALRASVLSSLNPMRYGVAYEAIKRMDPGVLEATKYGLNMRQRTDYAEMSRGIERMIRKLQNIPTIRQLSRIGGGLMHFNETALWEKLVPTTQYMVYSKEMFRWSERTGGKFLPGSREYTTAARRAADVANTVLGRLPTDLANPRLLQWARLALFSPQWTTTRVAMLAHAAGELGEILDGKLNPLAATYLPMQLRRVVYTVAFTWLISRALTGEEPVFNPNTKKFYAKTGLRGATGREVGFDITGFWQDDLKLFNAPFDFVAGRLNPTLRVAGETVSGRDYLGRPMTGIQRLENILKSFGPPTETLEFAARGVQAAVPGGAPGPTGGEILQRISGVLATANVATLPRPMDAALGKMAERMLRAQGMPSDGQSVFELSRLLRSNILSGQPLIDKNVITYLSYRRRTHAIQSPLGAPIEHLWAEGRRVLADF